MKKFYTTLLGFAVAFLCIAIDAHSQDEGNIQIKITKDLDGKKSTFEGTYSNRSEMESDPKYQEFVGEDQNFHFNFNGTSGTIEIEEFLDEQKHIFRFFDSDEGDENNFFFDVPDLENDLQLRLKDHLKELEERLGDLNEDLLEDGYMEELMEMVDDLANRSRMKVIAIDKTIRITDVEEGEFGKKGNVKSSELLNLDELNFYPNPSNGRFKLKFKTPEEGKLEISVYDLNGAKVYNSLFERFNGWYQEQIDLSSRDKGIYLLEIKLNQKRLTKKIVVN